MRFIGNKEAIAPEIRQLLEEKGLLGSGLTLFDACCGSGAVADALKDSFDVVINDIMDWSVTYTLGRLVAPTCSFAKLGFDPFEYLNKADGRKEGFFFRHYSPGESARMYFTADNAARIDFFRSEIETWRNTGRVDAAEYAYLLASLIESISAVSNTAGVYGAFLKHWDPRAKRDLRLVPVQANPARPGGITCKNERIEDIVDGVDCDVLYLDPPYTQNQYGTQYHLLETLVKNDAPSLSRVTGSRPVTPMKSDWSRDIHKHILFERVVANTKAKYIVFSYSTDGFMTKSYIEAVLKRHGKSESYVCRPIKYRKYTNTKSRDLGEHKEYLFFIEKRCKMEVRYASPLNYTGSKTRMIPFIQEHLPSKINKFFDIFGGAFNVGINSGAEKILYNDHNHLVANLIEAFRNEETHKFVQYVRRQVKSHKLEKECSESYLAARTRYNALPIDRRDPKLLFAVLLYGFNQQVRFNGDLDFNNPVGQRWFNEKILEKMISFSRILKERDVAFHSADYAELANNADIDTFVYMDPPYRLTTGAYNDGSRGFKDWNLAAEQRLFDVATRLHERSVKFMLSYVLGHKGQVNHPLANWIARNRFRVIDCPTVQGIGRKEVVIVNYD